jgi:hypothetical protein
MTLRLEDKKWLLKERKRQQQKDEKMKNSLALSKSTATFNVSIKGLSYGGSKFWVLIVDDDTDIVGVYS